MTSRVSTAAERRRRRRAAAEAARAWSREHTDFGAYRETLLALGQAAGLAAVGVAPADPFVETRAHLEARRAAGLHAGMGFTYRNPTRATTPATALPDAAALIVGALAYGQPEPPPPFSADRPAARVARYARHDYYGELKAALGIVAARLRADGWRTRVLADDNSLVDREAAYRAGLGWYGKNSNLLLPGRGSWFVLGSIVTDAPLPASSSTPVADGCGSCHRCLDGCPTGAIVAPGVVDARRCLAWLVQTEGVFPTEFREALGDRIYGCDDCQEVCPPNRVTIRRASREEADAPLSATAAATDAAWVPVVKLLEASDDEILEHCRRWYIPQRDPRYIRRNALVVLGNSSAGADGTGAVAPAVTAVLAQYLAHPDPLLRAHAIWAARRLGRHELLDRLDLDHDPDPDVRAELA